MQDRRKRSLVANIHPIFANIFLKIILVEFENQLHVLDCWYDMSNIKFICILSCDVVRYDPLPEVSIKCSGWYTVMLVVIVAYIDMDVELRRK